MSAMPYFEGDVPYVPAGEGRRFLAWLVDFLVFVLGYAAGIVAVVVADQSRPIDDGVIALIGIALLVVVPLLYGLFYTGGRALGGVLTGTRMVRYRDGRRIGAKGPWAMLIRMILLPFAIFLTVFGGGSPPGASEPPRVVVDLKRTRQLQAGGFAHS